MKMTPLVTGLVLLCLIPTFSISSTAHKIPSTEDFSLDEIKQPGYLSFLSGKAWQLVEIVSMNNHTDVPDDRSLYTVEFKTDGSVEVRADCNRGRGVWTSVAPGQLRFGEIATTRAQCLPGSLHDRYIAQFSWVRSYVLKGGHLFLATMADGSIIEFEPAELPLAATVLGEEVHTSDAGEMQEILLSRLFNRYAEEHGIKVTDVEINAYIEYMQRGMHAIGLTAEDEMTEGELAQVKQMRREMGGAMIRQWKLNRTLHRQYGGRIIFQQLGPEPLDAYRQYLEECQDAGDFVIHQQAFKDAFWRYFTTDSIHEFYEPGSEEEVQAFLTPPWQQETASARTTPQPSPGEELPAAADDGGPLNWEVGGVAGGLHLRAKPSTSSKILATYPSGTILNNLGCLRDENRVWCDVQKFGGGPRGYVAAEFLTAAVSPDGSVITGPDDSALRAGRSEFDAKGLVPCAQHKGQPMTNCEFGVARKGGGYATVVITKPDGVRRAIFFSMGIAVGADTSQADGYPDFSVEKEMDLYLIRIGNERYEIPEAAIFGG